MTKTITSEGFSYVNIKDSEAVAGDFVVFNDKDACEDIGYVKPGVPYLFTEFDDCDDPKFYDEDDDLVAPPVDEDDYDMYRKQGAVIEVSEKRIEELEARLKTLEEWTDALSTDIKTKGPLSVGDYGIVTNGGTSWHGLPAGEVVEVEKVDGSLQPYFARGVNGGPAQWLEEAQIRKATDIEIGKAKEPKVGDTLTNGSVVVAVRSEVNPFNGSQYISADAGLTVVTEKGYHVWYHIDRCEVATRGTARDAEKAKELYEKSQVPVPEEKQTNGFSVGDLIRITRYQFGDPIGAVVEVTSTREDSIRYASSKASSGSYGASLNAVELVVKAGNRVDK